MRARWACQERLATLLAAQPPLAGLSPSAVPPTDRGAAAEYVFCTDSDGDLVDGPLVSGRQINDDVFSVTVEVDTKRGGTHAECMSRLAELVGAVYDTVADGQVDGLALVDWGVEDDWEVHEVSIGNVRSGPRTADEGFPYATASIDVVFEVRYFGGNR